MLSAPRDTFATILIRAVQVSRSRVTYAIKLTRSLHFQSTTGNVFPFPRPVLRHRRPPRLPVKSRDRSRICDLVLLFQRPGQSISASKHQYTVDSVTSEKVALRITYAINAFRNPYQYQP